MVNEIAVFLKTEILTIALTVYGLFFADDPYNLLCAVGLLMVVFTIDSLLERESTCLLMVKAFLVAVCCTFSDGFLLFLLFGQIGSRRRYIVLPPLLFLALKILKNRDSISDILAVTFVQAIILFALSAFIWYIQYLTENYMKDKDRMKVMLGELAISELAERKWNRELLIKNSIIERNTRFEERENISRNIHNNVGHTITTAVMALEAAELLWNVDQDRAQDKVEVAKERIRDGLDSIRRAVRVLDQETENISMDDFKMELKAITDNFAMDSEIKVYLDFEVINCELMIPHEHTEFLTGAVGELLTNGVKHGMADRFTVRVQADSSHLKVMVLDNGSSDFNAENADRRVQDGFGIKKMISYVEKNGGKTVFRNEHGFYAELMLPIA